MTMSSNNYVTPFYFTQPPPNYNLNNSWNYNWSAHPSQNARGAQDNRNSAAPPLPPGPPPPPPPPSNPRTPSSHPAVSTPNIEQRSQTYYNSSNTQGSYRTRRYNNTSSGAYNSSPGQYALSSGQYSSPPGQYSSGQYSSPQGQYGSTPGQYSNTSGLYNITGSPNYARNFYNKRKLDSESDNLKKSNKKKKKPLSQNIPQRKDWSVMDAKRALMVEKEYNKRHRSQSLIIKFPDLELNRDIVSKFHSSIDNVHFQQPSTPRFCFVTLKESADPEVVIKELNKITFGHGYLTAEFKKDREDEINIGPEDIDPLTLYVGNLAQEVTKDDMVNTYPKQKRIDIGYAKKMKYTRYAFVSFKNVDDSIEAFQKTHATQMYSKSLIVRFRRLNGTVGMPGEPKPQLPQRSEGCENENSSLVNSISDHNVVGHNYANNHNQSSDIETESCTNSTLAPWEMVDVSQWETDTDKSVDLSSVKQEPLDDSDYEEEDRKPPSPRQYSSPFVPGDLDLAFSMHRPKTIPEIKKEKYCEELSMSSSLGEEGSDLTVVDRAKQAKPSSPKQADSVSVTGRTMNDNESNSDCSIIPPDKIKKEPDRAPRGSTYHSLRSLHPKPLSRDSVPAEVKKEPLPVPKNLPQEQPVLGLDFAMGNDKRVPIENVEGVLMIKSEPIDKDDENDGDRDDSSDDSDDFNFNNILSSIEARSKRLKKIKKSMP
ncbi:uncharacterized protein LOC108915852 [Anoplophora glabripennis]|uniref:uncharacterized protein LOC108915852 n=1 Tax=Anoplophora glabripennis TaxID=217634 RepID=UPI0008742ECC|nr:uncharacterized protein LOC108915852 [Anoplophora glabripennis]